MKKIILSLFALCAATSLWAVRFQSGLLYYNTLAGDSTVEVTYQDFYSSLSSTTGSPNNYSTLTAVTIPETVTYNSKTYTVVAIGKYAFTQSYNYRSSSTYKDTVCYSSEVKNAKLTLINIPKTVKSIGYRAFSYCTALKTVNFVGDGLESIAYEAFKATSSLKVPSFPQTLKIIRNNAFDNSDLSGSVTIPDNVTSIGEYAFRGTNMISLTIENAVTSIGNSAFSSCTSLTSVIIGNAVTSIGNSAFAVCSNLNSVIVGNAVTSIGSSAFNNCPGLTSVTLGNSVATIGSSAFAHCTSLPSITLPKSVKSVGAGAFASCSKLTTVYSKPTTPPAIGSTSSFPSNTKTFYVPCGAAETYFLSDWVNFTTTFQEECDKKYIIYVNQDCTSSVVEE